MPAGLQVWDSNGTLMVDETTNVAKVIYIAHLVNIPRSGSATYSFIMPIVPNKPEAMSNIYMVPNRIPPSPTSMFAVSYSFSGRNLTVKFSGLTSSVPSSGHIYVVETQ